MPRTSPLPNDDHPTAGTAGQDGSVPEGSGPEGSGTKGSVPEGSGKEGGPNRRQRKAVLLRLDPQLHDALARWAGDELRSTNAHVEYLLRAALVRAGRLPPAR